jgi:hypothetical protein
MSDDASTNAQTGTGDTGATTPPTPAPPAAQPTEINSVEQLPEFAQNMIRDLRAEAARHRTAKGDAVKTRETELNQEFETKLAESNTAHEATKADLARVNLEMAKLGAAIRAGVPSDKLATFAGLLQGSNKDELDAHAKSILSTFGGFTQGAVDPSQALNSGGQTDGNSFHEFILSKLDGNS